MSLLNRLPIVQGTYRENVNLAKFCWFNVGGPAAILYKPKDIQDLQFFIRNLDQDIPYFVFGVGSNLLIKDTGFNGVIIRLGKEFNFIRQLEDCELNIGAATLDANIANVSYDLAISGLEFFSGIPGTFGGALAMNAGAYGTEVKDILISARAINRKGEIKSFYNYELGYSYRSKELDDDWIFLDGIVMGSKGNKIEIDDKINNIYNLRATTQPINSKTGGSTFKNPDSFKAWQLIDQAGCRGLTIGGAKVSELHCNFFVNIGSATATDFLNLIEEVKSRVFNLSSILLKEEIKILE